MPAKLSGIVALGLALAGPALVSSAFDRTGPRPVVIGDVAYLPGSETRREGDKAIFVRATVRAVDVRTDRELWSIPVRDGQATPGSAVDDSIRTMSRIADGVLVRTFGGFYYVDPAAKTSRPLEDRRGSSGECEVHHRPFEDGLAPIHYGLARLEAGGSPEDRAKVGPHANTIVNAGCLVRDARIAAVRFCPACREAVAALAVRPGDAPK